MKKLNIEFVAALGLGLEKIKTCNSNSRTRNLLSRDPEVVERELQFTITEFGFNGDDKAPLMYVLSTLIHKLEWKNVGASAALLDIHDQANANVLLGIEDIYMARIATSAKLVYNQLQPTSGDMCRRSIYLDLTIRTLMSCAVVQDPEWEIYFTRHWDNLRLPEEYLNDTKQFVEEALNKLMLHFQLG